MLEMLNGEAVDDNDRIEARASARVLVSCHAMTTIELGGSVRLPVFWYRAML